MAVKMFSSIVIGSTATELKIFELSPRKGMREIDYVSYPLNLGADAYNEGKLDMTKVDEVCEVLNDFRRIMKSYGSEDARVVATSALREIRADMLTRDYIEKHTGFSIEIIGNAEQRLLDCKSIASESDSFEKIINSGTAIVDIGGSSIQISVFDKNRLITTQNIRLGKVSSREKFFPLAKNNLHFETLLTELMEHELNGFARLYQKDRQIKNLIVIDRGLLELLGKDQPDVNIVVVPKQEFNEAVDRILPMTPSEISSVCDMPQDLAILLTPSAIFARCLLTRLDAQDIWIPRMNLNDGLCYDYATRNHYIRQGHNFDDDIIASCRVIAKRYKSNQPHIKNMEVISLAIFDRLKKEYGLGPRERLLLQISVILHNCGKYISLSNVADCAYNIIMATEIIGLSYEERQIVANIVRFNTSDFSYYRELAADTSVTREDYLVIAKLTAILRVANALDRSHKQKVKDPTVTLKGDTLVISVNSQDDLTLEKGTLEEKAEFFEEVFNVHPVLKQRRKL